MSREIKFRAWDKKEKRWVYCHFHPTQLSWASPKYTEQILVKEIDGDIAGVAFENITEWKQFTGLKDKNGKEVYQGHILRLNNKNYDTDWDDLYEGLVLVVAESCGYKLQPIPKLQEPNRYDSTMFYHFCEEDTTEIIGTTTDDPGLLK